MELFICKWTALDNVNLLLSHTLRPNNNNNNNNNNNKRYLIGYITEFQVCACQHHVFCSAHFCTNLKIYNFNKILILNSIIIYHKRRIIAIPKWSTNPVLLIKELTGELL